MALAAPFPQVSGMSPRQARPASSSLRLTRRGRIVLGLAVLMLGLLGLIVTGRSGALATSDAPAQAATASVVVGPGESLWQIVGRVSPDADPRAMVLRIRELNNLPSSTVEAGMTLLVPVS